MLNCTQGMLRFALRTGVFRQRVLRKAFSPIKGFIYKIRNLFRILAIYMYKPQPLKIHHKAPRLRDLLNANLVATGQQLLEHSLGIVLARHIKQTLLVLLAVPIINILEVSRITHVSERIPHTSLLRSITNSPGRLLDPSVHLLVVLRAVPLDDLGPRHVGALGLGVEAESVAAGVRGEGALEPEVADGLPVDADEDEVFFGHDGLQGGHALEEHVVDDFHAAEEVFVGLADVGAGDEHVVDAVDDELAGLVGERGVRGEADAIGHSGNVEEGSEAVWLLDIRGIVVQDHGANGGIALLDDLGNDVGEGVGVVLGEVGSSLEESRDIGDGVDASKDLIGGEGVELELGDDAVVAAAALESPEELGVRAGGGVLDGAIRKDNLVLNDVVGGPAVLVAVEVDTAGKEETGDTDGGETASSASQVELAEVAEDFAPVVAGTNPDVLLLFVDLERSQVGHDEQRAVVDAVGALCMIR
jgi:hypothetical protein